MQGWNRFGFCRVASIVLLLLFTKARPPVLLLRADQRRFESSLEGVV
jgi:hypothetical protein